MGVVSFVSFSPQRCVCVGPGSSGVPDHHDEDGSTAAGGEHPIPQKVLIHSSWGSQLIKNNSSIMHK